MPRTRQIAIGAFLLATLIGPLQRQAEAALILQIDTYTTDQLSFTISGSFDAATVGESEGYLAIKNDWSNNIGTHTELFSSTPTIQVNTIKIGGLTPSTAVQNTTDTWSDDIVWYISGQTENPIAAGTTVSGSMTLLGVGAFDPTDALTLQLVSGFNRPPGHDDWARLEASASPVATAVPEPASLLLLGSGLMGIAAKARRRRQHQSQ